MNVQKNPDSLLPTRGTHESGERIFRRFCLDCRFREVVDEEEAACSRTPQEAVFLFQMVPLRFSLFSRLT